MTPDTRRPPKDESLDELPACKNCGEFFWDHMQDGEPIYMCPPEHQMGSMYGYFNGGDPRDFFPDHQDCSPDEIKRHREACAAATRLEANRSLPCPSGFERKGDSVIHVLRAPFGIGVQNYPPTCYER